jgi:hypothetical protein
MTTTLTRTPVRTTWTVERIQQEITSMLIRQNRSQCIAMQQLGPEALKQYQQSCVQTKIEHYRSLGVRTPLDLVRAMAEFEVNILGSRITIIGDEQRATLEYEHCACYNSMQKQCNPQEREIIERMYSENLQIIAREFGFKVEISCDKEPCCITFCR